MQPENRHWTDEEILHHLYGAKPRPLAHLEGCGTCRERVENVNAKLALVREETPGSDEYFVEQRRRIHRRIEAAQQRRWSFRVGSALVGATAMLVAVLNVNELALNRRTDKPPAVASDAELYKEISAMLESDEPRVTRPMRALFEEKQQ